MVVPALKSPFWPCIAAQALQQPWLLPVWPWLLLLPLKQSWLPLIRPSLSEGVWKPLPPCPWCWECSLLLPSWPVTGYLAYFSIVYTRGSVHDICAWKGVPSAWPPLSPIWDPSWPLLPNLPASLILLTVFPSQPDPPNCSSLLAWSP